MRRRNRVPHLFLREFICAVCVVASTAAPVAAELQIPTSLRVGPYGEMTSMPWFDPGAGIRSLVSVASDGEIRFDLGVRRPESTDSGRPLVGTLAGTLQYNAWGGYPYRQIGLFAGYQVIFGAEHGGEILAGVSTATSHAPRGHVPYEVRVGPPITKGHRPPPRARFQII